MATVLSAEYIEFIIKETSESYSGSFSQEHSLHNPMDLNHGLPLWLVNPHQLLKRSTSPHGDHKNHHEYPTESGKHLQICQLSRIE